MEYIFTFIVSFMIIYIVYYLIILRRKEGLEKFKRGTQVEYFKKVYQLNIKKINIKEFARDLSLTNAFIMSAVITIIEFFDSLILKMLAGFIIIIPLMLLSYKILGEKYKKKEGK